MDKDPKHSATATPAEGISRRAFVCSVLGGGLAVGLGLPLLWQFAGKMRHAGARRTPASSLTSQEFAALAAAQARILPNDADSPGAADIGATTYLDGALSDPRTAAGDIRTVRDGLAALQLRAQGQHGAAFQDLGPAQQDALLSQLEQEETGAEWLGVLVVFTLEALLGDPVYGGNLGERGWTWLGLTPPFPRPPARWHEEHA